MTMRSPLLALLLLIPIAAAAPAAAPTPSVLVTTIPAKTGAIPRSITAYGTIGASQDATTTIAIAYAAVITQLDIMPGQAVRHDQPLAIIAATPATRAAYAQAEAAVRAAVATLAHTRTLVAAHLATTIQLDQAEQAEQTAISARDALRRDGANRPTTTLRAPADGVIATITATPGATLLPGAPILTLLRTGNLIATLGLDPREAAHVHPGDPVALTDFTRPRHPLRATVTAIGAMVNPQSGLVDALVTLNHTHLMLGTTITAEIDTGTAHGIIVPRDAALPHGKGFEIWQIDHGHAHPVPVRIITRTAGSAVVQGNINPALPIVATGNYQLTPGIAVRVTH
jgi:RND family efflux transporter MFP subunit